jgi:RNA polymerase-binding transcription factor DksA
MVTGAGDNRPGWIPGPTMESWDQEKLSLQLEKDETRRVCQVELEGSSEMLQANEPTSSSTDPTRGEGLRRIARLNGRLRRIDEALHRIRTGRYGLCTSCGIEISRARLAQDLATEYCLLCQAEAEASSSRQTV